MKKITALFKNIVPYIAKPVLAKIHQLKDVYKGQSCYIFGDGISVKWFDLKNFSDKPVIPLSFLPFHNQFSHLPVEYCFLAEPYWFYPTKKMTEAPFKRIRHHIHPVYRREAIDKYPNITYFVSLSNYPVLWKKNVLFLFRDLFDQRLPHDFLSYRMDCYSRGSLVLAILLAVYFGCDHAFLVGCDYTHAQSRILHWYEKGYGTLQEMPGYNKEFFEIAKEFIDLTTITLEGKGTVLNHVTYEEHTSCKPVFRENHEIVDAKILQALSTWPGYLIY